jgi:hypothetical protein
MLPEDQIANALHANRVVALPGLNPHGPLGLEHLAETVSHNLQGQADGRQRVARPIALSVETWETLDRLARAASQSNAPPVTASGLAAALLEQAVAVR